MDYRRMAIEAESPEQFGYERIRCNLAESSVADMGLREHEIAQSTNRSNRPMQRLLERLGFVESVIPEFGSIREMNRPGTQPALRTDRPLGSRAGRVALDIVRLRQPASA